MAWRLRFFFWSVIAAIFPTTLHAETWEQQAERLQNVSAAMLDDMPFAETPMGVSNIIVKANVSVLPKTNPKVGGKSESVPSSPIHTVPTLQGDIAKEVIGMWTTGARIWAGYLPAGSEKLVGLKAAISQSVIGAAWINRFRLGTIEPGFECGLQKGDAKVKGAITSTDSNDEFKAQTSIFYGAAIIRVPAWRSWSSLLIAKRRSESEFYIPADQTRMTITDSLADASPTFAEQVAIGTDLMNGVQLGIAQIYVPNRLTMTRILVGWKVAL